MWQVKKVRAASVRQAKRYAQRWCAARLYPELPLREAVARLTDSTPIQLQPPLRGLPLTREQKQQARRLAESGALDLTRIKEALEPRQPAKEARPRAKGPTKARVTAGLLCIAGPRWRCRSSLLSAGGGAVLPLALIPSLFSILASAVSSGGVAMSRTDILEAATGRKRHWFHQVSKSSLWMRSDLALCPSLTAVSCPPSMALRIVLAEHALCSAASATVISLPGDCTSVSPCARHSAVAGQALPSSQGRSQLGLVRKLRMDASRPSRRRLPGREPPSHRASSP